MDFCKECGDDAVEDMEYCRHCIRDMGYDLDDMPPEGVCVECGDDCGEEELFCRVCKSDLGED